MLYSLIIIFCYFKYLIVDANVWHIMQGDFHRLLDYATIQGQEHSAASVNAIFLEVVGMKNKKGHVYGLG